MSILNSDYHRRNTKHLMNQIFAKGELVVAFRFWLIFIFVALAGYTLYVGFHHGWDLLTIFFGDIAKAAWPGQFNLDFTFMLSLSALWAAWRNRFSAAGIGLSGLALIGGSLFLSAYLLYLSIQHRGNVRDMLVGER